VTARGIPRPMVNHYSGLLQAPRMRPACSTNAQASGYGWRAISVQLVTVIRGQSRSLAVRAEARSAAITARIGLIPKLTARVRFPSPAPITKAQAREYLPAWALIVSEPSMSPRAIRVP
jgi:hypothetical protein